VKNKQKTLPEVIQDTISDSSLKEVSVSLGEIALDCFAEPGVIRDVPMIGSLLGLGKAALSVRDRLFMRKLGSFLHQLEPSSDKDRQSLIQRVNQSEEDTSYVGEKILHLVERSEDKQVAENLGRLFKKFLEREINFHEFSIFSSILTSLNNSDLVEFVQSDWDSLDADRSGQYQAHGLMVIDPPEVSVRDQDDWKNSAPYIVDSYPLSASLTERGKRMRALLSD